ncbi:hypothetical protein DB43_AM00070 [Parachlamydia acanthamoebae]|jgi:hypothetical protein|uniref:Uncharacterized protein n=1 Tax=Parachlamydia acanthamoebae TaxID=83552 RepID=A0A0C1E4H7_9BACT|nr:hypothetical protein DB43_AM00070 [Parachlamydia acanthamoebae]
MLHHTTILPSHVGSKTAFAQFTSEAVGAKYAYIPIKTWLCRLKQKRLDHVFNP